MKKWVSSHKILLLFTIIALFQVIFLGSGNPFRYDWAWPIFDVKQFWNGLTDSGLQGMFSVLSKNGIALFGLFGLIYFPPSIFFKLFIFSVHFIAGYGFYKLIKSRVKSELIAVISGIAYAFSPYIFIRTIVGFVWSMVAYAVLPIFLLKFWQKKKTLVDFLIIGFLFSLIFCQIQAGLLASLILMIYLVMSLFGRSRIIAIRNYFLTYLSLFVFALPWLIAMILKKQNSSIVTGGSVTTLNFIAALPHDFRVFFMLSDHHITSGLFYPLAYDKLYYLGWLIVWFVAFCAIFNKKNRELVLTLIISCLIILPFIKGPVGRFGQFYIWFYNHFPQIAVFRETYHFEFLYAISLCVLFAFGLDWLWKSINMLKLKVKSEKFKAALKIVLKTLFAGSAIFIIAPYLTLDYAGYLKLQEIPQEYYQLNDFFKTNKDYCHKIYYPPGLGFVYFKDDKSPGVSNSDTLASSIGIPYLTDGASVLNLPSEEMFLRNELVSQFYEKNDNGEFAGLLQEGGVDCIVVRQDMDTKYVQASNLWQEKNSAIVKKWNRTDLKALTESKKGLVETKRFGENIWIYKVDPQYQVLSIKYKVEQEQKISKPTTQQFPATDTLHPIFYTLPLTDWANYFAYYKDGWSRGRYDFWRKLLFTQLRQDFIYTDKPDSILTGKIDQKGDYEVWARYLTGGIPGELELRIKNYELRLQKDTGEEKFVWKKLGDIQLDGQTNVEIKNISGENAIADLVLLKK